MENVNTAKTVREMLSIAEFYHREHEDDSKIYETYGRAAGMTENAQDVCDTALSVLKTLNDKELAFMLYDVGIGAFGGLENLRLLRENILLYCPVKELLDKVEKRILIAEKKYSGVVKE